MGQTGQLGASEGETHLWRAAPTGLPANFTAPTSRYRRQAWLAVLGLATFVFLYLGALVLCAAGIVRTVTAVLDGEASVGRFAVGIPSLFFFLLLASGLMAPKAPPFTGEFELDPAKQPRLFSFVAALARDAGAPIPKRIFLMPGVNAAVVSDVGIRRLLWPGEKRLVLGLGLVNTLTLDEFTAVVAHELGHFAQRTMTVGIWVSVAARVSQAIVYRRGAFDAILGAVSRIDFRIAWIGWSGRLILWAWRAILETAYRFVILAERALGREMEFQADRVAVSVAGSDSIVHALHRLRSADEAWGRAVQFAHDELLVGRRPLDLYGVQSDIIEILQRVRAEPSFGTTPSRPDDERAAHRVFDTLTAQPPQLWSTHPANDDREARAKEHYVESTLDARSPWSLFDSADELRLALSRKALEVFTHGQDAIEESGEVTRVRVRVYHERARLDPRYQGSYLDRWPVFHASAHDELVDAEELATLSASREALLARADELYPPTLRGRLHELRTHRHDEELFAMYLDGRLPLVGGVARHRGRDIGRGEITALHGQARASRLELEVSLALHDTSARTVGLALAERAELGWPAYVRSLHKLLHATCHTSRELADAYTAYIHILDVALLDGRLSDAERATVLASAGELHGALAAAFSLWPQLELPARVQTVFDADGGVQCMKQQFALQWPTAELLPTWVDAVHGWARGAIDDYETLARAVLDELLASEARLLEAARSETPIDSAPTPAAVNGEWRVRLRGTERERDHRLATWDRFQIGDGLVWGFVRLAVASAMVAPALWLAWSFGAERTVMVVNGLAAPVEVRFDDGPWSLVWPAGHQSFLLPFRDLEVQTRVANTGEEVESFTAPGAYYPAIYDVARSSVLVRWEYQYSQHPTEPTHTIVGNPRWSRPNAKHLFADPPATGEEGTFATVITSLDAEQSSVQWSVLNDGNDREALVLAHLRFDPTSALDPWLVFSRAHAAALPVLRERATSGAHSVTVERALQDLGDPEACERAHAWLRESPDHPDALYLTLRCDDAFGAPVVEAYDRHPGHGWLAWLAAEELVSVRRVDAALEALALARRSDVGAFVGPELTVRALRLARRARLLGMSTPPFREIAGSDVQDPSVARILELLEPADAAPPSPWLLAARAMEAGDLTAAARADGSSNELGVRVAASYGADEALRREVADGSWPELGGEALAYQRALRIALGRPAPAAPDGSLDVCRTDEAWRLLASPDLESRIDEVRAETRHIMECQGSTAALIAIILGPGRTPPSVIDDAHSMLFSYERPSFASAMSLSPRPAEAPRLSPNDPSDGPDRAASNNTASNSAASNSAASNSAASN